ncbi:MAG TPA: phosphatidate cytidylyltransferase [Tepidisphaeraceae bacterium]|nr:phosphatidate cytidylyltransferase [Tepidisphaeraceae bacterium]
MTAETERRLFDPRDAFDDPVTVGVVVAIAAVLVLATAATVLLHRAGKIGDKLHRELIDRIRSWAIMAPVIIGPILLGAAWVIGALLVLTILCYREFARATGLFRERLVSVVVAAGIVALAFATFDNWYGLFTTVPPLMVGLIAAASILKDQPSGYLQRVALGAFAFLVIGGGLLHLAYFANDRDFRPILAWLLVTVQMNDVFAFISGKTFGRRKLAPNTSPNKTLGGALGALALTTTLVAVLGHFVFRGSPLDDPVHLIVLGLIVSVGGQLGDLMLSSVKRDVGIKDMAATIPGHGGFLDRANSLLLASPAVFHYVRYLRGIAEGQEARIITG